LTRPALAGLELTTYRLLGESTTTRLLQPVALFARQWILVKGFKVYSASKESHIAIFRHYLPVPGVENLRACKTIICEYPLVVCSTCPALVIISISLITNTPDTKSTPPAQEHLKYFSISYLKCIRALTLYHGCLKSNPTF
jgi:hypothetical protein